jgi:hypothetical protein
MRKAQLPAYSGPSDQECRALLARILASKEFHRTSRLRDFLLYVVDRKLGDAPQEVSEVLIGHRVFGRPTTYNPGEDSIVRTEARSLRQRLERYFAEEGRGEPLLLEIPKGGYLPVFRPRTSPRNGAGPGPVHATGRRWIWVGLAAAVVLALAAAWRFAAPPRAGETATAPARTPTMGAVDLRSSDARLERTFLGARQRALSYVYTGDPVGDWYDSTAGNRYAFCMRDVSHQSIGAAALGLTGHTRNMLGRFAGSIARSRDLCGFWEINKDGFPAPVDYSNDSDFWYCLPANFDLMRACYRQFLWTNDRAYFDAVFSNFYDQTVTSYVEAWDRDRDGVMEGRLKPRRRGIPSYYQEDPAPLIGGDLVAAQYMGYLVYASIQEHKGHPGSLSRKLADQYRAKAEALRIRYNTEWWNAVRNRYHSALLPDRTYYPGYIADSNAFALLFEITEEGLKTEAALDCLEKIPPVFDQTRSYFPEILFRYGRNDAAYRFLLELADPGFRSRGMPEISFAVVGAAVTGLMGVQPDAPRGTLATLPRLPHEVQWVRLARLPVLQNEVAVEHRRLAQTSVTNMAGPRFYWKAAFPASAPGKILVDGIRVPVSREHQVNGQAAVSAIIAVQPGQTRIARFVSERR